MKGFPLKRQAAAVYAPSEPLHERRVSHAQRSDQTT
jgi:hypothetical protein